MFNIFIISNNDNDDLLSFFSSKITLKKFEENVIFCNSLNYKKVLDDEFQILIVADKKLAQNLKNTYKNSIIIIYRDAQISNEPLDLKNYTYISSNCSDIELDSIINICQIQLSLMYENYMNKSLLTSAGSVNFKTNMYKVRYIKENFTTLADLVGVKNGVIVLITLDETVKTRVSNSRLALYINKLSPNYYIKFENGKGYYYLIMPNSTIETAKSFICELQEQLGSDLILRCGISKIGLKLYEEMEKDVKDSLVCAISNNEICACLTDNFEYTQAWLDDTNENNTPKQYKLFQTAYKNKLKNIIEPLFYTTQKAFEKSLKGAKIAQYANFVECVFSILSDYAHSELIIRYDGFTKIYAQIVNHGTNSPENTQLEIKLNKLTNKELTKLLNKLKKDFTQSGIIY